MWGQDVALHFNYSSLWEKFPLHALSSSSPDLSAGTHSFLPSLSAWCVEGPLTRAPIPFMPLICILCSAKGSEGHMEKPDGLPLPSGKALLFGWAPSQCKAGEEFQGRVGPNATVIWGAAPDSSQAMLVCSPLPLSGVFCQKQHFRKLKKKKGWVGREEWEKSNPFYWWPLLRHKFLLFLSELVNHNPWMKRQWTNSVKPWAPRMYFSPFLVLNVPSWLPFPTSTFEKKPNN